MDMRERIQMVLTSALYILLFITIVEMQMTKMSWKKEYENVSMSIRGFDWKLFSRIEVSLKRFCIKSKI